MICKSIATAAFVFANLGFPAVALASPDTGSGGASIETGDGPRDVGAKIEDGSGHRTVGAAIDDASEPRPDVLIPLDEDGNPILTKPVK